MALVDVAPSPLRPGHPAARQLTQSREARAPEATLSSPAAQPHAEPALRAAAVLHLVDDVRDHCAARSRRQRCGSRPGVASRRAAGGSTARPEVVGEGRAARSVAADVGDGVPPAAARARDGRGTAPTTRRPEGRATILRCRSTSLNGALVTPSGAWTTTIRPRFAVNSSAPGASLSSSSSDETKTGDDAGTADDGDVLDLVASRSLGRRRSRARREGRARATA